MRVDGMYDFTIFHYRCGDIYIYIDDTDLRFAAINMKDMLAIILHENIGSVRLAKRKSIPFLQQMLPLDRFHKLDYPTQPINDIWAYRRRYEMMLWGCGHACEAMQRLYRA